MITHFRHAGIVVSDLQKSLEFYCEWLGFKIHKQAEESGAFVSAILGMQNADVTTVKMQAPDGNLVELLYFREPRSTRVAKLGLNDVGMTHVALTVAHVDKVYEELSARGVKFTTKPLVSPDGAAKVTFCQDPDGNYLELVEMIRK